MTYITIDDPLLARLRGLAERVEIRDPDGQVIGHFTPVRAAEEPDGVERVRALFDLEKARETLARERDQGRSLKEIWARLQARENGG